MCAARSFGNIFCDADADCAANGLTCSEVALDAGLLKPVCGHPPSGAGALNAQCSVRSLENQQDCSSGICDAAAQGRCIELCSVDADCGDPLEFACTISHLGNVTGRWCAERCGGNSQCGTSGDTSRVCKRRCDTSEPTSANNGFDFVCTPPVGTRTLNQTLDKATENANVCASGFAIDIDANTAYCSHPCANNGDCGEGTTCGAPSGTQCGGVANTTQGFCRR